MRRGYLWGPPPCRYNLPSGKGMDMRISDAGILFGAAIVLAGCTTYGNDEMSRYLQRKDTVTLSAGDASRTNAMAQTLHPWPPGVGDRNIPMQGTRAAAAMRSYNCDNAQTKTDTASIAATAPGGPTAVASKSETKKDC